MLGTEDEPLEYRFSIRTVIDISLHLIDGRDARLRAPERISPHSDAGLETMALVAGARHAMIAASFRAILRSCAHADAAAAADDDEFRHISATMPTPVKAHVSTRRTYRLANLTPMKHRHTRHRRSSTMLSADRFQSSLERPTTRIRISAAYIQPQYTSPDAPGLAWP
jgi:hypothetical protein